jgi:hypothetical protein
MLGFLLVRLAKAVDRDFVASLSDLGLKPRDLRLLVLLDRRESLISATSPASSAWTPATWWGYSTRSRPTALSSGP